MLYIFYSTACNKILLKDEEASTHSGGVTLRRSGYYTIPPLSEIQADKDGNCIVEGFTIGREGYGNIHYPGNTNIAGRLLTRKKREKKRKKVIIPLDGKKPLILTVSKSAHPKSRNLSNYF